MLSDAVHEPLRVHRAFPDEWASQVFHRCKYGTCELPNFFRPHRCRSLLYQVGLFGQTSACFLNGPCHLAGSTETETEKDLSPRFGRGTVCRIFLEGKASRAEPPKTELR